MDRTPTPVPLHEDVSSLLGSDHERLDNLFADARRLAAAGELLRARAAFEPFAHGLARHLAVEEKLLFPTFDAHVPMRGPTTIMTNEHRSFEHLLTRARDALEAGDAARFDDAAAELSELLHAHNLKEERILYPRLDAALDPTARAELVARLQRQL
jgi:iron-sulfur cluster repair protein YtfE (RIC family)